MSVVSKAVGERERERDSADNSKAKGIRESFTVLCLLSSGLLCYVYIFVIKVNVYICRKYRM